MAKTVTTTFVSDVTGNPVPADKAVTVRFTIGDFLHELDASVDEIGDLVAKASRKNRKPGRKANGDAATAAEVSTDGDAATTDGNSERPQDSEGSGDSPEAEPAKAKAGKGK